MTFSLWRLCKDGGTEVLRIRRRLLAIDVNRLLEEELLSGMEHKLMNLHGSQKSYEI